MSSSVVMDSSAWLEPLQSEENFNMMPLVTSNAHIQVFFKYFRLHHQSLTVF
jgi:hypothetical protein